MTLLEKVCQSREIAENDQYHLDLIRSSIDMCRSVILHASKHLSSPARLENTDAYFIELIRDVLEPYERMLHVANIKHSGVVQLDTHRFKQES